MSWGWLAFPNDISNLAWIDDGKCLWRQMAEQFNTSLEKMESELTNTAEAVLEYCKRKKRSCHVLLRNRVIARHVPEGS